ncbi:MAG TPA: 2,3-bisphosphoglycerate-independent phosphoglycerate mutase [Thermoplasmata archaeon]|nr:2,3-bisphosphoglycerate-independent phosphoglycerate mutase [Thermoplasmata archaeon]
MVQKILLIIFDGLGDRPIKDLGNKTPLQAAATEHMDWFAANGASGLLDPIAPGVCPGSDTSHLALLGYDPETTYTGRGPFEAAGVGIDIKPGDVAFRANFATVDLGWRLMDRRAGRIREGTERLAGSLDGMELGDVRVLFRAGTEHRAALAFRGPGLDPRVTDTDPHEERARVRPAKALHPDAEKTAQVLNDFQKRAHEILVKHEVNRERVAASKPVANIVVTRGAGTFPHITMFGGKYNLNAAAIAGVALIKGICRSVGLRVLDVPGATGGLDSDFAAKGRAATDALATHDFVFLSVKAPDLCGHDGKPMEKAKVFERIDRELMAHLHAHLPADTVLAVTGDHSTPCERRDHSGDPVPVLIFGEGVRMDGVAAFDEVAAMRGGLGRIRGRDLMPLLLDLADRSPKYGA